MFDFSFGELAIIGTVALVVLGPERLPKVARTLGAWIGKAQRYVNDVKADIQREGELAELKKLQQQVQASARELETSMQQNLTSIESEFRGAADAVTGTSASTSPGGDALAAPDATHHEYGDTGLASTYAPYVPPPTNEELAAELASLRRALAAGPTPRHKYAPRARVSQPQARRRVRAAR